MSSSSTVIIKGMQKSLANARTFLEDSKLLRKAGSVGHAASLAVLGFEEAHKAYLLIMLLPSMQSFSPAKYKKDTKNQIQNHMYKQRMALGYQIFVQFLSLQLLSDDRKTETTASIKESLEKSKDTNLNTIKNDGFYVNPFTSAGVWDPATMPVEKLELTQTLLETHIRLIEHVIEFYSREDLGLPSDVMNEITRLARAISMTRGHGIAQLKRSLDQGGHPGGLVKEFIEFMEALGLVRKGLPKRRK